MPEEGPKRRSNAAKPAPPVQDSSSPAPSNATLPKPRRKQPTQQQRMLMQMKAQQEMEREQTQYVEAYTGSAFSDQLFKLLRTLFLIVVIGGGLLYYYSPAFLNKWLKRKPELPSRSIISVYPDTVNIRRDLPRFFHEYSLATPDNLPTRQAIQHIAALRKMVTNPGSRYRQTINLWPWELDQFRKQLPNRDALDQYCGMGTDLLYQTRPELQEDIVLWCLLSAGHDHGFLRYRVQSVFGSIARGIKGVAVRYDGHPNRVMAQSLLLLPFHKPEDLAKGNRLPPSTQVAIRTMTWLRQNAPLIRDFDELVEAMEDFLYHAISKEEGSWHWMYAACTAEERRAREGDPRVATMCTKDDPDDEEGNCCVIFDPHLHEFYGRPKYKPPVSSESDGDESD